MSCSFLDKLTVENIIDAYKNKGYTLFEDGEYNLNIFGIRSLDMHANSFNDCIGVLYKVHDEWKLFVTDATTDAGLYYRNNPMNVSGTALIAPGQHRGAWTIGRHQGKYPALVQNKPILLYRDADRDEVLTYKGEPKPEIAGINLHRASASITSKQVDKWSAGCCVVADPNKFQELLELCYKQVENHSDSFSFTLFEEQDINL